MERGAGSGEGGGQGAFFTPHYSCIQTGIKMYSNLMAGQITFSLANTHRRNRFKDGLCKMVSED